jgi:hypothetical protein
MLAESNTEANYAIPSPNTPDREVCHCSFEYTTKVIEIKSPQAQAQQSKRGLSPDEATSPSKRPCISPPRSNEKNKVNPLEYWTNELRWPKEYFEPKLRGSAAPTSTTPREAKSAPYQSSRYKILLETKGSFMRKSELDITNISKTICRVLLEAEQVFPRDSLFHNDRFDETCEIVRDRNEAKVIQDITRLIVPSAQSLAIYSAKHLKPLTESINEGWDSSIALTKPRPQPDYTVGFERNTFTEGQLKRI